MMDIREFSWGTLRMLYGASANDDVAANASTALKTAVVYSHYRALSLRSGRKKC
jgi:hypothetical protein